MHTLLSDALNYMYPLLAARAVNRNSNAVRIRRSRTGVDISVCCVVVQKTEDDAVAHFT